LQKFGTTRTMPNTTVYDFGDVILVPFPFTDQTATKKRPAIVVSSDDYNKARPDVILMAITGHLSGYPRIGEVVVSDWKEAGLLKASTIKPILTTLEKTLIIRALGRLTEPDILTLKNGLATILG
jgi:mRNA interferase MazF